MSSELPNPIKICTKCNIPQSLNEFWNDKHTKDGKVTQCKTCKRNWQKTRIPKTKGNCRLCKCELTPQNWSISNRKSGEYLCKACACKEAQRYRALSKERDPELYYKKFKDYYYRTKDVRLPLIREYYRKKGYPSME